MAYQTFPLSAAYSAPVYYTQFEWTARNAIHYEGQAVVAELDKSAATDYDVIALIASPHLGYECGDVVATGSVTGTTLNLGSSFDPGCYRVRLYKSGSTDANWGDSAGASNFAVIRANANFPTLPVSVGNPAEGGGYLPGGQGHAFLDDPVEFITSACVWAGTHRLSVARAYDPNSSGSDKLSDALLAVAVHNDYWWNPDFLDPVRERHQWVAFPNGTVDTLRLAPNYMDIIVADASLDGSNVYVSAEAGGGAGGTDRLRVYYPDAVTLVETWDVSSQADTVSQINGHSDYIYASGYFADVASPSTAAAAPIGSYYYDGVVESVVALYAAGVTHFEGPSNEPDLGEGRNESKSVAHKQIIFQGAVHAGNASAKAMGPCTVSIANIDEWRVYLQQWADEGKEPDVISMHDYNSVNGDLNMGRNQYQAWYDLLREFGWEGKQVWETEAMSVLASVTNGVYHPNRDRMGMMHILFGEQYGITFEHHPYWYAYSHGFWSHPAFAFHTYGGDKSPNPIVVSMGVYAQEVYGKAFHHPVDFRHVVANRMFIGNVYGDAAAGSVAAIMCASWMPDSTVTLEISGTTAAVVVVDGTGNSQSYPQTDGKITIPVLAQPTYVRLPAGANMRVDHIRDWATDEPPSISELCDTYSLGGQTNPALTDDGFMTEYVGQYSAGMAWSSSGLPDAAQVTFPEEKSVSRVVVFHGAAWEAQPYPLDYEVQTLPSGQVLPSSTAALLPGTAAIVATGDVAWQFPDNIKVNDGNNAACSAMTLNQTTQILEATNFGFAIPNGAQILGVNVYAECGTSGGTDVVDHTIKLIDAGSIAGTNMANASGWSWFPTQLKGWGGQEELWGVALTPAKVNASDFGVAIRATNHSALATVGVDYVTIVVYYTTGSWPLTWITRSDPTVHVAESIMFGTDATNAGCQRETYTQEPWITDDAFAATDTQGVKYAVADASFGGEPDTLCVINGAGNNLSGHGMEVPMLAIGEVSVLSDTPLVVGDVPGPPTFARTPLLFPSSINVNEQVQAESGLWPWADNPTSLAYQWQSSVNGTTGWADVVAATRSDYVAVVDDQGLYFRCGVTAVNSAGQSAVAYTAAVGPVGEAVNPTPTTLTLTPAVVGTLTITPIT